MTAVKAETLPARALAAGEGEARWWFGQLAVIKATAEDTAGGHTLVEITVDPGYETPLHIHHREDEGFCVQWLRVPRLHTGPAGNLPVAKRQQAVLHDLTAVGVRAGASQRATVTGDEAVVDLPADPPTFEVFGERDHRVSASVVRRVGSSGRSG